MAKENEKNIMVKLMNFKDFKNCSDIDNIVPDSPGIYCLRIKDISALKNFEKGEFVKILRERKHDMIYIGIAEKSSLKKRLNQELKAKGPGTFFRSLGAIMGFRPSKGSLINKKNKSNYEFSKDKDEPEIIKWINKNLTVNWAETNSNLNGLETKLIQEHLPLLNLKKMKKNQSALLKTLRKECQKIANSS